MCKSKKVINMTSKELISAENCEDENETTITEDYIFFRR